MNGLNSIKKFISSSFIILYNIVSLLWCYILVKSLIFEFSIVKIGLNGIDIIGGADTPTLIYKMGNVIRAVFPILFIILSVAIIFLLIVSILKKQMNRKLNILLSVLIALSLFVFMMIPFQTYYISFYILVKKFSFLKYTHIIYIMLSFAVIVKKHFGRYKYALKI